MPSYDYTVHERPNGRRYARARVDGTTRMFSGDTEREVHALIAAARTDVARGTYVDPNDAKITVRAYGEQWRASHPSAWSTRQSIRNSMEKHWYPRLGDVPMSKLRPSIVQHAVSELAKTLAPLTLREVTVPHLKQMLNAAVDDRLIASNPAARVKLPAVHRDEIRIPTLEEVEALLDVIDERSRALIAVGAGLGLRQGEAFGLSKDRVTLRDVKIDRQLKRVERGSELGKLKTKRSYRTVPLPQWVATEIAVHLERFPNDDPDGLLFVAPAGGRLRRDQWGRRVLKPATEKLDIEWLTFHSLRHFYASALIRANHQPAVVAKRLGNTAQMVHETYAHLWADDDDRTRQAIDDLFDPSDEAEETA